MAIQKTFQAAWNFYHLYKIPPHTFDYNHPFQPNIKDCEMKLTSPEFTAGQMLPLSFQADQENASPQLNWDDVPQGVKSFAVAMHDPDAPTGGAGWWH